MGGRVVVSTLGALGLALASATAGRAAPPEPAPTIDIRPDAQGASGVVRATIDIDAPPARVWAVMVDCAEAPRLMVNVRSCRVLDHDPAGRWDIREQVTNASLLPAVRMVLRSEYDYPHSVRFHRIDGDFKVLEGSWLLEPIDGGNRTRVTYQSRMTPPFAMPNFIVRAVLRKDLPRTLINLRTACEARGTAPPRGVAAAAR